MSEDDPPPRGYSRFRRPLDWPRERKPFSIARDPTKPPLAEALRRARMQRQGKPWEPRPRYQREEYTPPEGEPER